VAARCADLTEATRRGLDTPVVLLNRARAYAAEGDQDRADADLAAARQRAGSAPNP
jgi:hypothetical protein